MSLVQIHPWAPGTLEKLRELAAAPFNASSWEKKAARLGWRLKANNKYQPTEFGIYDGKTGVAAVRFEPPQLSQWPAKVNHYTLDAENTPAFAEAFEQLASVACASLGQPNHRLTYLSF